MGQSIIIDKSEEFCFSYKSYPSCGCELKSWTSLFIKAPDLRWTQMKQFD